MLPRHPQTGVYTPPFPLSGGGRSRGTGSRSRGAASWPQTSWSRRRLTPEVSAGHSRGRAAGASCSCWARLVPCGSTWQTLSTGARLWGAQGAQNITAYGETLPASPRLGEQEGAGTQRVADEKGDVGPTQQSRGRAHGNGAKGSERLGCHAGRMRPPAGSPPPRPGPLQRGTSSALVLSPSAAGTRPPLLSRHSAASSEL